MRFLWMMLLASRAWCGVMQKPSGVPRTLQNNEIKHGIYKNLDNEKLWQDVPRGSRNTLRDVWLNKVRKYSTDVGEHERETNNFREVHKNKLKNGPTTGLKNDLKCELKNESLLAITNASNYFSLHNPDKMQRDRTKTLSAADFGMRVQRQKRWYISPVPRLAAFLNKQSITLQIEAWAHDALLHLLLYLDACNGHQVTLHLYFSNTLSAIQRSLHEAAHKSGAPVLLVANSVKLRSLNNLADVHSKGLIHVISVTTKVPENMRHVWQIMSLFHSTNVIGIFIIVCINLYNTPQQILFSTLDYVRDKLGTPDIIFLDTGPEPHLMIPVNYDMTYPEYEVFVSPLWKLQENNVRSLLRRWGTSRRVGSLGAYTLSYYRQNETLDTVSSRRWTIPPELNLLKVLDEYGVKPIILRKQKFPTKSIAKPWVANLDPVNLGTMCRRRGDYALTFVAAPVRQVDVVAVTLAAPKGAWGRALLSLADGAQGAGVAAAFHLIAYDALLRPQGRGRALAVFAGAASLLLAYMYRGLLPSHVAVPSYGEDLATLPEAVAALDTFYVADHWADAIWNNEEDNVMDRLASKVEIPEQEDYFDMIVHNRTLEDTSAILMTEDEFEYASRNPAYVVDGQHLLHKIEEKLLSPNFLVFRVKKNTLFAHFLECILLRLMQGGIYEHWFQEQLRNATLQGWGDGLAAALRRRRRLPLPKQLRLRDLQGPFWLLARGLGLGLFVLAAEVLLAHHSVIFPWFTFRSRFSFIWKEGVLSKRTPPKN